MTVRAAVLVVCAAFLADVAQAQTRLDIAKGWRFQPDRENVGMAQKWYARETDDSNWATLDAGARWEDQGFAVLDGYGWYRKWVNIPEGWAGRKIWLVLGGINDCGLLFCNGRYVASYGE